MTKRRVSTVGVDVYDSANELRSLEKAVPVNDNFFQESSLAGIGAAGDEVDATHWKRGVRHWRW